MVSVGRVEKLTVPKNILVSGETLKSKRRKNFTPRFSGYLVFSKENRDKVMEELQAAGQLRGNCIQKMMREVGRRWALLSLEEKAEYSSRAGRLKEEVELVKVEEISENTAVDLKSHPLVQTKDKPHNCKQSVEKLTVPKNSLVSGETLKSKRRKKFTPQFSGYLVFSKENRGKVMEEMRAAGDLGGNCIQKMMREVGRRWALLSPEEKVEYSSRNTGLEKEAMVVKVEENIEKSAGDLYRHHLVHIKDKPHKCQQCVKSFSQASDLKRHKQTHSGEKPFTCEQCERSFSLAGNLKTHQLAHSDEKPHICEQCEKCFSRASSLKIHKRTHIGEKPYSHDSFSKSFSVTSNLIHHQKTHTGEEPRL